MIGKDVDKAAGLLQKGDVVAVPTETVYGLAANAFDEEAVLKVFEVKNRPKFNPLIVHVAGEQALKALVTEVPEEAAKLIKRFWPGPLTLLLPKSNKVSGLVTAGSHRVALRNPDHPVTLQLLGQLGFPLVAPSANPFQYVSPTTARHVEEQLGNKIPYILDGGPCRVGIESTIVGFENGQLVIYRPGGLSVEEIEAVAGTVALAKAREKAEAPGMLKTHYAPGKPFLLGDVNELIRKNPGRQIAALTFQYPAKNASPQNNLVLAPSGNLHEAALNLFDYLRKLDEMNVDLIVAETVPDESLGRAINDRLERAANRQNR